MNEKGGSIKGMHNPKKKRRIKEGGGGTTTTRVSTVKIIRT